MLLRVCAYLALAGFLAVPQPGRREVALVITGGTVVTMDDDRVFAPGAVAIDGREIVAVGAAADVAARFAARTSIDASGDVVLPGLVNTHTHAPMVLYRGLADDLALMDWLQKYIFPAEAKTVSPEFVRAGTRLAAVEMIRSGTTTYTDMYYFEEEIAKVTREAGLRAILGQTIIQFPVADARTPREGLARAEAFIRQFKGDDLVVPAVAPHALYTLSTDDLRAARALADREGVPLVTHLAETNEEVAIARRQHKATPVAYLDSLGFFGPPTGTATGSAPRTGSRTIAAHGVWLTDEDIGVLARRQVGVAHNPESNMKLASGTARVTAMRAAGIPVGVGTDGAASNNDLDMFEAMRVAALVQKQLTGDPTALPARTALQMATIEGARAIGLDRDIGSLAAGKRADVIVVSMSSARQTPVYDPVSHLVYTTRGDDVKTTVVNGRILMQDRRLTTLDEAAVLEEARTLARRVRAAVSR